MASRPIEPGPEMPGAPSPDADMPDRPLAPEDPGSEPGGPGTMPEGA